MSITRFALLAFHCRRSNASFVHDVKSHATTSIRKRKLFLRITHETRAPIRLRRGHRHASLCVRVRLRRRVSLPPRRILRAFIIPFRIHFHILRRYRPIHHATARHPHNLIQPLMQRLSIMTHHRSMRGKPRRILIRVMRIPGRALIRVRREYFLPGVVDEMVLHRSTSASLPGREHAAVGDERAHGRRRGRHYVCRARFRAFRSHALAAMACGDGRMHELVQTT